MRWGRGCGRSVGSGCAAGAAAGAAGAHQSRPAGHSGSAAGCAGGCGESPEHKSQPAVSLSPAACAAGAAHRRRPAAPSAAQGTDFWVMWARGEQRAHQPKGAVAAEELDRAGLDAPRRRVQPRSADLAASEGRAEVLDRSPSSGGMPGPVRAKAPPLLPAFTVFSGTDPPPAKGGAAQHLRGAGSAGDAGFGVASLDREVLIYVGYGCGIRITGRNGPAECGTSCPSAFVPNKRSISRDRVDRQKGLPGLTVDHLI